MKNVSLKIFIVILVLTLICVSVIAILTKGFTCDIFERFQSEDVSSGDMSSGVTDESGHELDAGVINSLPSQLNISQESLALALEEGKDYIELTLEAKIIPEDATDQSVDWSLAWADGTDSSDISEYLTVTPTYDGSRIISLKCYQPFEKQIVLTVITREGGFSDNCLIKFEGQSPYNMICNPVGCSLSEDGLYQIPVSGCDIEFDFYNFFGQSVQDVDYNDLDLSYSLKFDMKDGDPYIISLNYINAVQGYLPYYVPFFINDYVDYIILNCFSFNLNNSGASISFVYNPYDAEYGYVQIAEDNTEVVVKPLFDSFYNDIKISNNFASWESYASDLLGMSLEEIVAFNKEKVALLQVELLITEGTYGMSSSFEFYIVD